MKKIALLGVLLGTFIGAEVEAEESGQSEVHREIAQSAFLNAHCIRCHNQDRLKADRRFDDLPKRIKNNSDLERYQEIIDQLNLESMPPDDEPQPTIKERSAMIARLTQKVSLAHKTLNSSGGHSVLRRLNSWEYRHTIGDLLGLNVEAWNPAEDFPAEVKAEGFDNNGASLVTSGMLLNHYFTAAEVAVDRATQFGERPESKTYQQRTPFYFSGKEYDDLPKLFRVDRFRFIPDTPYTDLYGRHYRGGHIGFLPLVRQGGVTHSGIYKLRVRAAAVGRVHDYGKALGDFRNGDPLVMEIAAVDRRGSVESTGNVSKMISLARIELTNEKPQWFEWTAHIDAGYEPEIRFRNGPLAAKRMIRLLTNHAAHKPEFKPFVDLPGGMEKAHGVLKAYRGPRLRIWEIQLEGPQVNDWPSVGHRAIYGLRAPKELTPATIPDLLQRFAEKAFRRPPLPGEVEPIQQLIRHKIEQGMPALQAYQLGCQSLLCTPGFLYLNFGEGELDDFALASRLSYFLWSSLPDDTLLTLARSGDLRTNLNGEVERMLADPKSDRFAQHFLRRWLDLDNIGEMPPSETFVEYHRDNLRTAMRGETEAFFRHVLHNDLPLREFLEADYSFLNRELALHYGIGGVQGNELQRTSLRDSKRGGLISQGAFLTASANGIDTSPVVRGIYVLEKILGHTPPPPPQDVPAIEPDIRGATTIRSQLEKHRENATCAECHRKIDPLGFALEHFNAVGQWRDEYAGGSPIDATGQLPGGDSFSSIADFRDLLIEREDQFERCMANKLMTYALGRQLEASDRPYIDQVLSDLESRQGGLATLIELVVLSEPFLTN